MDKKTLHGKSSFAILTENGTLIQAHDKTKKSDKSRKISGTFADGTQVHSPIVTMDKKANILSVTPAAGKSLSVFDLKLATEYAAVCKDKLKATQIHSLM